MLLDHVDIVSVVDDYIGLRRSGTNYKARCPFHEEKTPSFVVSETKQIYHCFGCGVGGNAINFIMKIENIEFMDALKLLAERFNITVNLDKDRKKSPSLNDFISLNVKVCGLYKKNLAGHQKVKNYLKERQVTNEEIESFEIGYAPDSWQYITNHLKDDKSDLTRALTLGLVLTGKENKPYDYFRNRLLFPIKNQRSQIIGFGGRVLDSGMPKYLNSRDSLLYNKSATLFGIDKAKKEIVHKDYVILTEGYFDVVTLHRFDFTNAVAISGTALTHEHLKILTRFTKNILFLLDGDEAGINAMLRSLPLIIQHEAEAKICILPKDSDADSFLLSQGKEALSQYINNARDLFEYYIECNIKKNPSVTAKSELAKNIVGIVEASTNPVMIDLYLQKTASLIKVEPKTLRALLNKKTSRKELVFAAPLQPRKNLIIPPLEKILVKIALSSREYLDKLLDSRVIEYFSTPEIKDLLTYLQQRDRAEYSLKTLIAEKDAARFLYIITQLSFDDDEIKTETIDVLYTSAITKLEKKKEVADNKKILEAIKDAERHNDQKLLQELLVKKQSSITKSFSKG